MQLVNEDLTEIAYIFYGMDSLIVERLFLFQKTVIHI